MVANKECKRVCGNCLNIHTETYDGFTLSFCMLYMGPVIKDECMCGPDGWKDIYMSSRQQTSFLYGKVM